MEREIRKYSSSHSHVLGNHYECMDHGPFDYCDNQWYQIIKEVSMVFYNKVYLSYLFIMYLHMQTTTKFESVYEYSFVPVPHFKISALFSTIYD
jgi:hypothetical protein